MPWIVLQHLSSTALKGFYSSTSNAVTFGYLGRGTPGILVCWFIASCIIRLFCCCFFLWRVKVCTKTDGSVNIHPKSVNVEETEFHYNWLVYHLKMRTSSVSQGLCLWGLFVLLSLLKWAWIRVQRGCEQPLFWGLPVLGHSLYTPSDYVLCDTGGIVPQLMNFCGLVLGGFWRIWGFLRSDNNRCNFFYFSLFF